jgi:hypothetical protein
MYDQYTLHLLMQSQLSFTYLFKVNIPPIGPGVLLSLQHKRIPQNHSGVLVWPAPEADNLIAIC